MTGSIKSVAFLGTGIMGAPMTRNLLRAGFSTTVWNRTRSKAEALADDGASVAATPRDAVGTADIVITMLKDGDTVEEVLFNMGCVGAARPGAFIIDMSSIEPARAREHATRLMASGHRYLDAPVSGGDVGAREATLAIMVGAEEADFERVLPLFNAMGRATRVGPNGSGQLAKLANQAIVGITIGAVAEALLLTAAGGADPAAVRRAMAGGFADSRILQVHGERMIERRFEPGGRCSTHYKDMNNILDAAAQLGLELPLARTIRDEFADVVSEMDGSNLDHSALLMWLEAKNPPHKLVR